MPGDYGNDYDQRGQQVQLSPHSTRPFVSQEQPVETEGEPLSPLSQFTTIGSHSENNTASSATATNDQPPLVDRRRYIPLPRVDDHHGLGEPPNLACSSEPSSLSHATSSDEYVLVSETSTVGP